MVSSNVPRQMAIVVFFATAASFAPLGRAAAAPAGPLTSHPVAPQQALATFQVAPGVRLELVASEPEVVDPVAIRFDEDGRMWVVEMGDYPSGPQPGEAPRSRIRILEDRDGDGRFEVSHLFADHLLFPTGLQPWRGGVLVTLAGSIDYLKDTDGDDRADLHETWFTGFAQKNSQLRANHPTFAIDGRVYVANGLRGGKVSATRGTQQKPMALRGHDFSFDPLTRRFQTVAGQSQFGMTFDDNMNRFLCSNRNPLMQVVLEDRYLERNPHYPVPAVVEDVARAGAQSRVFPLSRAWTTSTLHAGQFTAACGCTIYRGDALPASMVGNAFICEPTGNLVHREVLEPAGATFGAHAGREGVEFLASRDEWFRPVNMTVGPDGALYVVDMYRAVIEHPDWMPDELRKRPDLRDGDDRGRIYRLVAATSAQRRSQHDAGRLPRRSNVAVRRDAETGPTDSADGRRPERRSTWTSQQLVAELTAKNAWRRDTAVRLLVERQARRVTPQLRQLAIDGGQPATRIAALHLLADLGSLTRNDIRQALRDRRPGVRQQAVVLAETWIGSPGVGVPPGNAADHSASKNTRTAGTSVNGSIDQPRHAAETPPRLKKDAGPPNVGTGTKGLRRAMLRLAHDPDPRVRFQVALSLAPVADGAEIDALRAIALASPADRWTRRSVILAAGDRVGRLLCAVLKVAPWQGHSLPEGVTELLAELATQTGTVADIPDQHRVLVSVTALDPQPPTPRLQRIVLAQLAHAMRRQGRSIASLLAASDARRLKPAIDAIFTAAEQLASDRGADVRGRCEAVQLLAHAPHASDRLAALASNEPSQRVRIGAIEALSEQTDLPPWRDLLAQFPGLTPAVRRTLLDAILARPDRIRLLFHAMAAGAIRAGEIDRVRRQRLLRTRDAAIRERAKQLFNASIPADRMRVLADYRPALTLPADPHRGREVFRKNCATCHRIGEIGVRVGPDIGDTRVKTPAQLLTDILQPNRAIDSNYVAYAVMTEDGRALSGLLAAETASSITLTQEENKTVTLTKDQIEQIRSTGVSLMPEGLEKNIPKQQMADLISFLKNWRYLDGKTPARGFETQRKTGTRPVRVSPSPR